MGYAGYAPAKYAPPKPTEVQAALRQVAKQESYDLLSKLLRNVVRSLSLPASLPSMAGQPPSDHVSGGTPARCKRPFEPQP